MAKTEVTVEETEEVKPVGVTLAAGTVIQIGDRNLTLTKDSKVWFDGADNEQFVVGLLVVSKNLEVNREKLKRNYTAFGVEIPETE